MTGDFYGRLEAAQIQSRFRPLRPLTDQYYFHNGEYYFYNERNPDMVTIPGAGPDAPVVTNSLGGMQSDSPYRMDLLPPFATLEVAGVLKVGTEKYEPWNWLKIPPHDHLSHALCHAYYYLAGERSEGPPIEHLKKAACRVMMALDVALRDQQAADREALKR